jgi:hypothetical protein
MELFNNARERVRTLLGIIEGKVKTHFCKFFE